MTKKSNHEVIQSLSKALADTYVLFLKTQNYHWNVTGPHFGALHATFQAQYEEIDEAVDLLAERLRALGEKAPGSFTAFAKLATIKEENGHPSSDEMLKNLAADQEIIASSFEKLQKAAEEIGDDATADIAINRIKQHQKNHWMLKAHLE